MTLDKIEDQEFLKELQKDFLDEVSFMLEQCEESYLKLEAPENRPAELANIFRLAHSMKGAGAAVGFTELSGFAHIVEDCLSVLRTFPHLVIPEVISLLLKAGDAFKVKIALHKQSSDDPWQINDLKQDIIAMTRVLETKAKIPDSPKEQPKSSVPQNDKQFETLPDLAPELPKSPPKIPDATLVVAKEMPHTRSADQHSVLKIDAGIVESFVNIVGELVVIKSQLLTRCLEYPGDTKLNEVVSLLEKTTRELQDQALQMRMTPLKGIFLKTQRIIRDLSIKLNKPAELIMAGEDTELDRTMVEYLSDPLMHIARNSLDHGIESEERRTTAGKPLKGTIRLSAHQVGGRVMVEIADDGGGLNKERILARAIERKLIPNNRDPNSLSDREINQFIFANGFSTAEKITDVSGRGVGMDVVKTNVEKLKGTIEIQTQSGIGTTIIISIPLTTAISDAMIVTVRGQTYILAMDLIVELLNMNEQGLTSLEGGLEVLNHRGKSIPIINLSDILPEPPFMAPSDSPPPTVKSNLVALVQVGDQLTGLRLEKVLGQTQVVLKPLGENFKPDIGISGAAILGDGKVGLVIDPFSLKTVYKNRVAITENEAA